MPGVMRLPLWLRLLLSPSGFDLFYVARGEYEEKIGDLPGKNLAGFDYRLDDIVAMCLSAAGKNCSDAAVEENSVSHAVKPFGFQPGPCRR
jgi:NADPH-dependent glutamate synthase beta subunit-like oxidoreductase